MDTFSQGNESWKKATKDSRVYACYPGLGTAEGTLRVVTSADVSEDEWPYTRTEPNPDSARIFKSLVSGRTP